MLPFRKFLSIGLFLLATSLGLQAANTTAELFLDATQARPGETIMAAVRLKMAPGWHTYWENSGDSGYATKIKWSLPQGVTNGAIQWPVPEKVVISGETTFGYHDEAVLLVPLHIAADAPAGQAKLSAKVSWLECEKLCLPGNATVAAEVLIGDKSLPSDHGPLFTTAKDLLPKRSSVEARAYWADSNPTNRSLVIEWKTGASGADFFPALNPDVTISAKSVVGQSGPDAYQIRMSVIRDGDKWPDQVTGVLTENAHGAKAAGYAVGLPIGTASGTVASAPSTADPATTAPSGFGTLLLQLCFGFLGGLILNVMPCVLPVIALKILGVVGQNRSNPAMVRRHGMVYALGVLASFAVMAGVILGLRSAGKTFLWGTQFGSPVFLVVLCSLMVLMALSLFGVFEVTLSGKVMDVANRAGSHEGLGGAFFNGIFATVMGVSCTAPILSAAVGFALAPGRPVWTVFAMFLSVGAGLAGPYLLLSFQPGWLKFLPKPGAWMERFKIAMGFPMLATAVWLFTLVSPIFPGKALWLGLFLVLLAAAAWVFGEFVQRGRKRQGLAWFFVLLLLGTGYGLGLERELNWRNPPDALPAGSLAHSKDGIQWEAWSPAAITEAQAAGRPVFVDFTAEWCVNCQVNKRNAIEVPAVEARLKELNVLSLLADYTRTPETMSQEILSHGRAGVPLVLVYPGKPGAKPEILPELFTQGMLLEALERATADKKAN
jgi:thiol:disulfide interchange protein/DsbC/DsbD-like thiol-disulfide interchange protein